MPQLGYTQTLGLGFIIGQKGQLELTRCMVTCPFKRKVKAVTLVVIELIAVVDNSGCSLPSGQTNLLSIKSREIVIERASFPLDP